MYNTCFDCIIIIHTLFYTHLIIHLLTSFFILLPHIVSHRIKLTEKHKRLRLTTPWHSLHLCLSHLHTLLLLLMYCVWMDGKKRHINFILIMIISEIESFLEIWAIMTKHVVVIIIPFRMNDDMLLFLHVSMFPCSTFFTMFLPD